MPAPVDPVLVPLGPGVWAHIGTGRYGRANAGVVVDDDGTTMVDTLVAPAFGAPLAEAVAQVAPAVRRVVLTSSHVPFVGGSTAFTQAAFYGAAHTSAMLDLPPNVAGYRRLFPDLAGWFDDEFRTRPISHTVGEAAYLTGRVVALPLAGQAPGNLVAVVPDAGVLFAGALATFGTTPLAFDGDPGVWASTLRDLCGTANTVVPGHGPVGGDDDLRVLADYLDCCVAGAVPAGPWDRWHDRHFDVVNIERARMLRDGEPGPPPSMLRLLGL